MIYQKDCIELLSETPAESVDLIYIDPPFNTGDFQTKTTQKFSQTEYGRLGFGNKHYKGEVLSKLSYLDARSDYLDWMYKIVSLSKNVLKSSGSIYLHLDYREAHYVKVLMDDIFGEDNFLNEIIWAWDYGARTSKTWPRKHNNILWYSKSPNYFFDIQQSDRIEYLSPALVGAEKAERGKTPTDVFWITIVPTNGKEKTGYPNQKPEKLLERLILTTCPEGGTVMDFFAGSGTTGAVAKKYNRNYILSDINPKAIEIMKGRLE